MRLDPYRRVLAIPHVRALMIFALLARIPMTGAGMALTFHVLDDLHGGYAKAGLVGTATTVAIALGAPFVGRLTDRRGLRSTTALSLILAVLFRSTAPFLPYPVLLVAAFAAGLVAVPVFSTVRQGLAALVPEEQRRTAFAIDSMSTELSYMAGPGLAIVLATQFSARAAMIAVGVGIVASGVTLFALNPRTNEHAVAGQPVEPAPPRRSWLRGGFVSLLLVCAAATVTLAGSEIAMVAALRQSGQVGQTSVVIALWCLYSLVGGFVYGALRTGLPSFVLAGAMAALTIPIGLFGTTEWWVIALAIGPAGALCAPVMSSNTAALSRLVPAGARGEAMGIQGSAMTIGMAAGAPLSGWASDTLSPGWAFAIVGLVGLALTAAAVPFWLLDRRRAAPAAAPVRAAASSTA